MREMIEELSGARTARFDAFKKDTRCCLLCQRLTQLQSDFPFFFFSEGIYIYIYICSIIFPSHGITAQVCSFAFSRAKAMSSSADDVSSHISQRLTQSVSAEQTPLSDQTTTLEHGFSGYLIPKLGVNWEKRRVDSADMCFLTTTRT